MDAFTNNLIDDFIGFDNVSEFESGTFNDEEKDIHKKQMNESRGAFLSVMIQINFENYNHDFCPIF